MTARRTGAGVRLLEVALLVAAVLCSAPALAAQQPSGEEAPFRAWAVAEATWKITQVADRGASLYGGSLEFGLTPRTAVGGAGYRMVGTTAPDPGTDGGRRRMTFGYAGFAVEHLHSLHPDWQAVGALLVGAGHGTVHDRELVVELGADSFAVVELQTGVLWRRLSPFGVFLGGGYRFVSGVQDLPGVSHADLRSAVLTLGFRLSGG